jgi:pimeloyl-ACP methyl ester carboxylesterase
MSRSGVAGFRPRLRIARGVGVLLLAAAALVGCVPAATTPIATLLRQYDGPAAAHRILIVYLPGSGDSMSAFEQNGLLRSLRERGVPADVISVNAHLGYYREGSVSSRLEEDVMRPARAAGYRQIWFVGDSLGAYGALSYAREHPGQIAGLVLLGPYLGERSVFSEIERAGGLGTWDPGVLEKKSRAGDERLLWLWFRDAVRAGRLPPLYLGYGRHDRFSPAHQLLASLLPGERVIVIEGGHDWPTWKQAWDQFLERGILPRALGD